MDLVVNAALYLGSGWALYLAVTWLASVLSRPRPVEPAPPTPDLLPEPSPAVVNYLVNGCRTDPDAAIGTLLDLAARNYVELYQPGNDPDETIVRVREPAPAGLKPYEQRVFERIPQTGTVTLAEFAERYAEDGYRWSAQFAKEVAADAKAHRLARSRSEGLAMAFVFVGFVLSCATAVGIPGVYYTLKARDEPGRTLSTGENVGFLATAFVLTVVFLLFSFLPLRTLFDGERRTAAGKAATAHWLGVGGWLRAHESFAELPPSAVAVWDRYLAYGAALDVTPVVSRTVDLAIGSRAVLWSRYSGQWREVQVHYPRRGQGTGQPPLAVIIQGLLWLGTVAAGVYAVRRWGTGPVPPLVFAVPAAFLVVRALYRIVRAALDWARPVEVVGLVISRSVLPRLTWLDDAPPPPGPTFAARRLTPERLPYFVVVDDGRSPTAPLWTVTPATGAGQCQQGDIVRLVGYRWCRFTRKVTVSV